MDPIRPECPPPEPLAAARAKFERTGAARRQSRSPSGGAKSVLVPLKADVVVAGGGMAGVCAAVAAARSGASVILVQDRSRLGGNSSSEVRMHICGANWHKNRPGWRESGLLEEFRLDDAVNNPQRCREMWDLMLYDKVVAENGITLLLDTAVVGAETRDARILRTLARCEKTELLYRLDGEIFCDCTGDCRLAIEAGADIRRGREARSEFGETLAPDKPDGETLGSSILFTSRKHGRPMPFAPPSWARKITEEELRKRTIKSWEYGYWWIEWGGHLDTIEDNERIRFELLSIVMGIWDHIKNSGRFPESAEWALDWVGMIPGKRESRRIIGDHVLTERDLIGGGDFEDAVAIGGWPMDDHPPGGFDRADESPGRQVATRDVYNIPLRSLYSRNVANLFMAGRNISASHVAFTSTRVMGTCSAMGQAVGTAAALCARHGIGPRQLYERKDRLRELQQRLIRDDQTIKGIRNEDAGDVARLAAVRASGEEGAAAAVNVINGWLRDIPAGGRPAAPEQDVPMDLVGAGPAQKAAVNHWAGRLGPEGAWIELSWEKPHPLREIQVTFDTGFHRELTLTSSDSINRGIVRGPQPETVRDYAIWYGDGSPAGLKPLARVEGNHRRVNRHRFAPIEARTVRVHVSATNGDDLARIFEIRCYR